MTDGTLLVFGCGVSFIALAGAYVYFREGFVGRRETERSERERRALGRATSARG